MNHDWNYLKRVSGVITEMAQSAIHEKGNIVWDQYDEDFVKQAMEAGISRDAAIRNRFTTLIQQHPTDGENYIIFTVEKNKKVTVKLANTHFHKLVEKLQAAGLHDVSVNGLRLNARKLLEKPEIAALPIDNWNYMCEVLPINDIKNIKAGKPVKVNEKLPAIEGSGKDFEWTIGTRLLQNKVLHINPADLVGKDVEQQTKVLEDAVKDMVKEETEKWGEEAVKNNIIPKDYYNRFLENKDSIYKDLFNHITWTHRAYDQMTAESAHDMAQILLSGTIYCLLRGQVTAPTAEGETPILFIGAKRGGTLVPGFNSYYLRHVKGINTADKSARAAQTGHGGDTENGAGSIANADAEGNKIGIHMKQADEKIKTVTPEEKQAALARFNYHDSKDAIDDIIRKIKFNELLNTKERDAIVKVIEMYDSPVLRAAHQFPDDKWKILSNSKYVDLAFADEDEDKKSLAKKEHFKLAGLTPIKETISFNEDVLIPHWRVRNQMVNEIGGATTGPGATYDTANYQVEGDPTGKFAKQKQIGISSNANLLNDGKKTHRRRYKNYK